MATGIVIHWTAKRPPRAEVGILLEDFFAGVGTVMWGGGRWNVAIAGLGSPALRRMPEVSEAYAASAPVRQTYRRTIEVWTDADGSTTEVMARFGDELTWALAKGVAETMRGWWQGEPGE